MKRFFKLLCFVFIAFFMLGLGGEKVLANVPDTIKVSLGKEFKFTTSQGYNRSFHVKTRTGASDEYKYIFCLDSAKKIPDANQSLSKTDTLYPKTREKVKKVIAKAYELGLGKSSNSYSLSNDEFYAVTQMVVWKTVHGTRTDGYRPVYSNWVSKSADRTKLFNDLNTAASESNTTNYKVSLSRVGNEVVSEDEQYTIYEYQINSTGVPSDKKFTLSVTTGTEISKDGTNWGTTNLTLKKGDKFKIRIKKPESGVGKVEGTVKISSESFFYDYDLAYYTTGVSEKQNMGLIVPKTKSVSNSATVSKNYNVEVNETTVKVRKVDKNGNKINNATLQIFKKDGDVIVGQVNGTDATDPDYSFNLEVGEYYIKEVETPSGYIINNEKAEFSVVNNSGIIQVMQNGEVVESAVIIIENQPKKLKFRKLDSNGNPIEGVRIEIGNYNIKEVLEDDNYLMVCAITDKDGYLTKPCTDIANPNQYYQASGEYEFDLTKVGHYYIHENFKKGFYTEAFSDYYMDFWIDPADVDHKVLSFNTLDVQIQEDSVINVYINNQNYLGIKKTDVTTGAEIAGAHLAIYDKENSCIWTKDDSGKDVCDMEPIEEWVSEAGKDHRFTGIEIGHRYVLSETIAPEGYIKMTTNIEFEMDKDGNVTTYDSKGNVIKDLKGTDYELIITNDYTKVTISKTDMVTSEEVPGAKIKLCTLDEYNKSSNDCKGFAEWTSGKEPHQIDRLAVGKYCLIETIAPKGYAKKTSAVCFEVKEQSGIQQVEFTNQPIKMVVSKKNQITGERISGATLQILNAKDRTVAKTNTGAELVWVSNDKSDWEITGIPVGDYILVETITPEGYQEGMVIDGEVVQEYAFTITGKEDVDIELYVPVLNAPNTGLSTLNLFAIGALLVFTGYETIKIYRKRRVNG